MEKHLFNCHELDKSERIRLLKVWEPETPESPFKVVEFWTSIPPGNQLNSEVLQSKVIVLPPVETQDQQMSKVSEQPQIIAVHPADTAGDPPGAAPRLPQEYTATIIPDSCITKLVDNSTQTDITGPICEVPEVLLDIPAEDPMWVIGREPIELPKEDIFEHYHLK